MSWEDEEDFSTTVAPVVKNTWEDEVDVAGWGDGEEQEETDDWDDDYDMVDKPIVLQAPKKKTTTPAPKTLEKPKEPVVVAKNPPKQLTAKEIQEQQEKADFEGAKELFGVSAPKEPTVDQTNAVDLLKTFVPKTKQDFEKYADTLIKLFTAHETNFYYREFLKYFLKQISNGVTAEDLKEIVASLNLIINEKIKKKKTVKKKAKKINAKTKNEDEEDTDKYIGEYDEFADSFM
eukprot:TRINITY_DN1728_c0_g1_i1.p1 TRINITY_DN1728_c0_g1~~TRINITY_DN1728_c0_g1_i1.p1  ORF type:complete len:234 (+),score=74.65 TRINITY_DN1728_c0_g1_i1:73-774(+)